MTAATCHTETQTGLHMPRLLAGPVETIRLWHRRASDRALLARLDERSLRDARISHATLWNEMAKPFWRG